MSESYLFKANPVLIKTEDPLPPFSECLRKHKDCYSDEELEEINEYLEK